MASIAARNNGFNSKQQQLFADLLALRHPDAVVDDQNALDDEIDTLLRTIDSANTHKIPRRTQVSRIQSIEKLERWIVDKAPDSGLGTVCTLRQPDQLHTLNNVLDGGLFAIHPIPPGTQILRIPHSLMLRASSCTSLHDDARLACFPSAALVLAFIEHSRLQHSSPFSAYIASLPNAIDAAWQWSSHTQRIALAGTTGLAAARRCRQATISCYVYVALHASLPVKLHRLQWQEFAYASAVVLSRQNELSGHELALIPAWDQGNHHAVNGAKTFDDGEAVCAVLPDNVSVNACGDSIWLCYGSRQSVQHIVYQGFIDDDESNDTLIFNVDMHELECGENALTKIRRMIIAKRMSSSLCMQCELQVTGEWTQHFHDFARACVMDRQDAAVALRLQADACSFHLSMENERRALTALHTLFAKRLKRLQTLRATNAEQRNALDNHIRSVSDKFAERQKIILHRAIQRC